MRGMDPKGRARATRHAAGLAGRPPRQAERIRRALAGEAEIEEILRRVRAAVSTLFPIGVALAGKHRRSPLEHHGAAAGQRGLPAPVSSVSPHRPPDGPPQTWAL